MGNAKRRITNWKRVDTPDGSHHHVPVVTYEDATPPSPSAASAEECARELYLLNTSNWQRDATARIQALVDREVGKLEATLFKNATDYKNDLLAASSRIASYEAERTTYLQTKKELLEREATATQQAGAILSALKLLHEEAKLALRSKGVDVYGLEAFRVSRSVITKYNKREG